MTSPNTSADPRTTLFLLGVSTVVAQALLLREAMAAMGGSEMAWGTFETLARGAHSPGGGRMDVRYQQNE